MELPSVADVGPVDKVSQPELDRSYQHDGILRVTTNELTNASVGRTWMSSFHSTFLVKDLLISGSRELDGTGSMVGFTPKLAEEMGALPRAQGGRYQW